MDMKMEEAQTMDLDDREQVSAAAALTTVKTSTVNQLRLKFTTLSDGNEKANFTVTTAGGTIGRSSENNVCVPSDAMLQRLKHASIELIDSQFHLKDSSSEYHAAIRCGVGHAAREWPLSPTVCFSAGNTVFEVMEQAGLGGAQPTCHIKAKTGPKKGTTTTVTQEGATVGRANDNTVCISDRELSRRHSCISYRDGGFHVSDLGSTNGTYVQLVGPYAGRYPLNLNDHILVGRTGFSINRYDYGLSEEIGMRRTMEDKSIIVHDLVVPELSSTTPGLAPQTWMAVYDGHGGDEASAFLQQRLHMEVSLSLGRAAPRLIEAFTGGGGGGRGGMGGGEMKGGMGTGGERVTMPHDALVKEAMTEAFLACDQDFIANHGSAGSTATTVLMLGQRAYCCNVGDSRTVLSRAGRAVALSNDHKPSREDEAARIKAAGGFIINKRVMGELAVSRAFGDSEFKKGIREILGEENTSAGAKDESAEDQDQDLTKPLVVAEPEIDVLDVTDEDEFILLACDGLFDVMSNQEAVDFIRTEMASHGDAQRTAESLTRTATVDLSSRDNVSVLVVFLRDL